MSLAVQKLVSRYLGTEGYLVQGALPLYRFQGRLGLILWTELTSRLHLCSFFVPETY
jgi:hypothetical protein